MGSWWSQKVVEPWLFLPPNPPQYKKEECKFHRTTLTAIPYVFIESKTAHAPLLLFSHGNACDLSIAEYRFRSWQQDYSILCYDYPGYGWSLPVQKPTQKAVNATIEVMLEFAIDKLNYHPNHIFLFGESIGTGPSAYLASTTKHKIGGLILQSAYSSIKEVVKDATTSLSGCLIPAGLWNTKECISKVTCPVLLIHGALDTLIPLKQAEELYEASKASTRILVCQQADHNSWPSGWVQKGITEWIAKLKEEK